MQNLEQNFSSVENQRSYTSAKTAHTLNTCGSDTTSTRAYRGRIFIDFLAFCPHANSVSGPIAKLLQLSGIRPEGQDVFQAGQHALAI